MVNRGQCKLRKVMICSYIWLSRDPLQASVCALWLSSGTHWGRSDSARAISHRMSSGVRSVLWRIGRGASDREACESRSGPASRGQGRAGGRGAAQLVRGGAAALSASARAGCGMRVWRGFPRAPANWIAKWPGMSSIDVRIDPSPNSATSGALRFDPSVWPAPARAT